MAAGLAARPDKTARRDSFTCDMEISPTFNIAANLPAGFQRCQWRS
jgi:hypothetical protein